MHPQSDLILTGAEENTHLKIHSFSSRVQNMNRIQVTSLNSADVWISVVALNPQTHTHTHTCGSVHTGDLHWSFRELLSSGACFLHTNPRAQTHTSLAACCPSPSSCLYLGHGSPESSSIIKLKIRNSRGLLILGKGLLLSSLTHTHTHTHTHTVGHSDTFMSFQHMITHTHHTVWWFYECVWMHSHYKQLRVSLSTQIEMSVRCLSRAGGILFTK